VYGRTEYSYGHIELMPCMEALMNGGRSMVSGRMIGKECEGILPQLKTFEDFYQAYMQQVNYRIENAIKNKIKYYDEVHKIAPEPYLSSMVEDCIENGRDMTEKGARYRMYALFATGLSHCIDSLCAIKKLVYDERIVSLQEAVDALKHNWEGHERLRQSCLTRAPKYGNDDDAADGMLTRFLKDFADQADAWNRRVDWLVVTAGVATFENYPRFGHNAWASFDGRLAHEAFSSNFSPAVGRDRQGPTAVLLSASKFDLTRLSNGCPVDLRVSFNKETLEENAGILEGFIESFVALGGNMMTITKVDYETLKKAQQNPKDYQSLRVRLGGVTAYFVQLAKPQQDEYMRRTEHAM
jgi:formate C-acetyltransferase